MESLRKTARLAGLYYLLVAITGGFSLIYVPSKVIVAGDVAGTAQNLLASEALFRAGIVVGLISNVLFILLVLTLYKLLSGVDKHRAMLMVAFVVAAVPIACLNMLNQFAALHLLSGTEYLTVFGPEHLQTQAMLFLELYDHGIRIAAVFWGLWLLPLGSLVIESAFIPRVLGIFLIIGGCGYVLDSLWYFLVPDRAAIIGPIMTIPSGIVELAMIAWLLIKGVRDEEAATG